MAVVISPVMSSQSPSPSSSPEPRSPAAAAAAATPVAAAAGVAAAASVSPRSAAPFTPFLRCVVASFRSRMPHSKPYTEFQLQVTTPALHWDVFRRYSEFAALHKALIELIAEDPRLKRAAKAGRFHLPKLPPSKFVGNLKENFLFERMHALHTYLVDLLAIEQLHTCRPVLEFVGALTAEVGSDGPTISATAAGAGGSSGGTASSSGSRARSGALPHLHVDAVLPLLDAGDVVLFKTIGTLQSLQRAVTGSRYDHVGLVIRIPWSSNKPSALHVLESTSDGVHTYQLARRLRAWHLASAVVVVRQLKNVRRTDSFLTALDSFVSDVDGLPYAITLGKLLRREPGASTENFFCSELVAAAYMRVGLLDGERQSATAFYPSDFNEHNSARLLKLQHGAALGPELRVDFVQPPLHEARQNQSSSDGEDSPDAEQQEAAAAAAAARRAAEAKVRRAEVAARRARENRHEGRMSWASSPELGPLAAAISSSPRDGGRFLPLPPPLQNRIPPSAAQKIVRKQSAPGGVSAGSHAGASASRRAPSSANDDDDDDDEDGSSASLIQVSSPAYIATAGSSVMPWQRGTRDRMGSVEPGTLIEEGNSYIPQGSLALSPPVDGGLVPSSSGAQETTEAESLAEAAALTPVTPDASAASDVLAPAFPAEPVAAASVAPSVSPPSSSASPETVPSDSPTASSSSPSSSSSIHAVDLSAGVGVGAAGPRYSVVDLEQVEGRGRRGPAPFVLSLNEHYLAHGAVGCQTMQTAGNAAQRSPASLYSRTSISASTSAGGSPHPHSAASPSSSRSTPPRSAAASHSHQRSGSMVVANTPLQESALAGVTRERAAAAVALKEEDADGFDV